VVGHGEGGDAGQSGVGVKRQQRVTFSGRDAVVAEAARAGPDFGGVAAAEVGVARESVFEVGQVEHEVPKPVEDWLVPVVLNTAEQVVVVPEHGIGAGVDGDAGGAAFVVGECVGAGEIAPVEADEHEVGLLCGGGDIVLQHALEPIGDGKPAISAISELLWEQDFGVGAPAFLIFAVNWGEYMRQHGSSDGFRMAQLDLGAFMQTTLMVATGLGLRTFITPALDDARVAHVLGTEDSEQAPSYLLALGAPTR
jgi:hypothetical protein